MNDASRRLFVIETGCEVKMGKTIVIVANGAMKNRDFHAKILKAADMIVCADGGANGVDALGYVPDFVIGDMDSIKKKVLEKLKKNGRTKIIEDPDQDKTDTELAISLAESFKPNEMIILGAIGDRFDHTLANILCLMKINRKINAGIVDSGNEIRLVEKEIVLEGKKDQVISVFALTEVKGMKYEGLKWPAPKTNLGSGWFGISNRLTRPKGKIKIGGGKVLVVKSTG